MDISSSVKLRRLGLKFVKYVNIISIFNKIINSYKGNVVFIAALICLLVLLAVNDYIRDNFIKSPDRKLYFASYLMSVIMLGILNYKMECFGTELYNVVLLIEIIVTRNKIKILPLALACLIHLISTTPYMDINKLYTVEDILVDEFWTLFIVFLFRNLAVEKVNTENLNKELNTANLALTEYSAKIEELTITKERTRIAQELHDSIGHSLVALKMNLEYAENIVELKPEKAKEVIKKAGNISKDCLDNLRAAVNLLKEENSVEILRKAINELFEGFKEINKIKLHLEMDDKVEACNPDIKNCIYKTVREAVTNGIKHGNANTFFVKIIKNEEEVLLKIKNDGAICENVIKSNGISGMEQRVKALGGNISFTTEKNYGFVIEVHIPQFLET